MNLDYWLDKVAKAIDLTPNDIEQAQSKRKGLQSFLLNHEYPTEVYIQGSFSYGTAIKPVKKDKDGDFDLDLVCEVDSVFGDPKKLKKYIGDILKKSVYNQYLEPEGKRCWTLDYDNFHIDLLPAEKDKSKEHDFILITNKDKSSGQYTYISSNPKGLTRWFNDISNQNFNNVKNSKKSMIFEENKKFFMDSLNVTKWQDVNDIFISTPIQNAVKILKRHRDKMYVNTPQEDDKPISVIITVLTGLIVLNNQKKNLSVADIIETFIRDSERYIKKVTNKWIISNPLDNKENLADRWSENNGRKAKEFYRWIDSLVVFIEELRDTKKNPIDRIGHFFGDEVFDKVQSLIDKENKTTKVLDNPTSKPWSRHV